MWISKRHQEIKSQVFIKMNFQFIFKIKDINRIFKRKIMRINIKAS